MAAFGTGLTKIYSKAEKPRPSRSGGGTLSARPRFHLACQWSWRPDFAVLNWQHNPARGERQEPNDIIFPNCGASDA
jgi:hypothetical protein